MVLEGSSTSWLDRGGLQGALESQPYATEHMYGNPKGKWRGMIAEASDIPDGPNVTTPEQLAYGGQA